jgi:MFS transporter, ACS family, tartrate transporter
MWKQQQSIASTGGSSRFFYNLLQLPRSNQYRLEMLHWVGARLWLAQILMSWGAVATCMAFTSSAWSFYLLRFRFGGGLYAGRSLPHLLVPPCAIAPKRLRAIAGSFSAVLGGPI